MVPPSADNGGLPANIGRMSPYGALSMAAASTTGLLTSFSDPDGRLRFAGAPRDNMTTDLSYGVVCNQNPKVSYPPYSQSVSAVVFKYGVQLSGNTTLRSMIADVPVAGVKNGAISWYSSITNSSGSPFSTPLTQADIDPATIFVGPPNTVPTANNDAFNMLEDQSLFVTTGSVLNNDTDPDAEETLIAELVASAAHGALEFNANGTFSYIPVANYNGIDTFTYRVRDRYNAASNVATVSINVADINDEPVFTAANPADTMEDAGTRTITNWANFNPGSGETQGVAQYEVLSVSNPTLFTMGGWPIIDTSGTLRFTPAANTSGSATFVVRVRDTGGTDNGGINTSPEQAFSLNVMPVNDAPTVITAPIASVGEDSGQQSIPGWASFNAGPNEADQVLLGYSVSAISNPSLFTVPPTVAPDGTLVFTSAPNAVGTSTFTLTARDSGGTAHGGVDTSAPQVLTINVTAVNDAPTVAINTIPTILEDSGARSVTSFASFSAGPGESGQSLAGYTVSGISDPAMFLVPPSVSNAGTLTYTPAANASGSVTFAVQARDNGGTASGGVDTSAPVLATINITPVNDAPSFAAANPPIADEDAGTQTIANWASFAAGPNEGVQGVLSYTVSNVTNQSLFAVQPSVAADGTLTFTPAANASGTANFSVRVRDNGGISNGGVDTSSLQTFTVNVSAVNDAPSVAVNTIPTIVEDGGPKSVSGFASFNPGPGETGQSLVGYTVSNVSNPAMFAAGPSVANNGTLTYTPSSNASGSVTFTVTARDNGGTSGGGVDTSAPALATINITNVNDAPTFAAANPASNEDAGTVTLAGWAAFNPGPFEDGQTAEYQVTSTTNVALFAPGGLPAISPSGTLTYATAENASGTAAFTARVRDNGGTASGGVDLSAPQVFTITVNAVNDAPIVSVGSAPVIEEDAPAQTVPGFAAFQPGPGESGQSLVEYLVSGVSNPAAFTVPPAINNAGTLTYTPAPDASGTISFVVRARDNGGTMNGGIELSQPVEASLNINGVNDPPVAVARDITVDARTSCVSLLISPAQIDNGSRDPDNGPAELNIRINRTGEFPVGVTPVILTVTDPAGLTSTAQANVTVLASDANRNTVPDSCDLIRGGGGPDCDDDGDSDESQCVWDNGAAAPMQSTINGQLSQFGGTIAHKVVDDIYLQPGLLYRLTSFRGQILTNSIERGPPRVLPRLRRRPGG